MEAFFLLLGIFIVYLWVHFIIIQFSKNWDQRNSYERFVTIAAIVTMVLSVIGQTRG